MPALCPPTLCSRWIFQSRTIAEKTWNGAQKTNTNIVLGSQLVQGLEAAARGKLNLFILEMPARSLWDQWISSAKFRCVWCEGGKWLGRPLVMTEGFGEGDCGPLDPPHQKLSLHMFGFYTAILQPAIPFQVFLEPIENKITLSIGRIISINMLSFWSIKSEYYSMNWMRLLQSSLNSSFETVVPDFPPFSTEPIAIRPLYWVSPRTHLDSNFWVFSICIYIVQRICLAL